MEFSRQEFWNGLLFSSPGELPDPGIKPRFPALQADSLPSESPGKPMEDGNVGLDAVVCVCVCVRARARAHVCIDAVLSWVNSDPLSVAEEGQLSCALWCI